MDYYNRYTLVKSVIHAVQCSCTINGSLLLVSSILIVLVLVNLCVIFLPVKTINFCNKITKKLVSVSLSSL